MNSRKMAKHFAVEIRDGHFAFQRRTQQIEQEARLDGIYVIRTSVPAEQLDANEAVQAYKDLSRVERAFRSLKTVDLDIRPIRHWTAERVRAHVFLCMLAYHVEWHSARRPWHRCCSMTPGVLPRGRTILPHCQHRAIRARQGQEGDKALSQRSARHGLRRSHRPSRHPDPKHHARAASPLAHRFTLYAEPTKLQEDAFRLLNIQPTRVQ